MKFSKLEKKDLAAEIAAGDTVWPMVKRGELV